MGRGFWNLSFGFARLMHKEWRKGIMWKDKNGRGERKVQGGFARDSNVGESPR